MEPDGLPMRESGEWIKRKHHYLRRYCDMFTKSMKGKWKHVTYIDLLAGPGICKVRTTGELLPGSPLIAMEYPFTDFQFYEGDAVIADALQQRVAKHEKAVHAKVVHSDWQQVVLSSNFALPDGLTLAFVDPTGISQVPWDAMQKLASSSHSIDILMTVQHGMGIKLNQHQYAASKKDKTAVDNFLGNSAWRSSLTGTKDFCEAVLESFTLNMEKLGYKTQKWMLVKNDQGVGLYYLCLFSRHDLALKFWNQVVLKDERGQRSMDL